MNQKTFSPARPTRAPIRIGSVALTFVLSLVLTTALWHFAQQQEQDDAQEKFDQRVDELRAGIVDRLETHEQILVGAAGLFASVPRVGRRQWQEYVNSRNVAHRYPGIQGVGYAVHLQPGALAAHERAIRNEGFPEYAVHPNGTRDEYTAILFIEPFDERNRRTFGYDMFSESVRRAAMARARDTGMASLSGRVTLLQEMDQDVQAGFLMYVPVYRKGVPVATVEQRRAALQGYAYAPFRANDFVRNVFGEQQRHLFFELHADDRSSPTTLLYESRKPGSGKTPRFTRVIQVELPGVRWSLRAWSQPEFETEQSSRTPWVVLAGGGIVTVLLTLLVAILEKLAVANVRLQGRVVTQMAEARVSEERFGLMMAGIKDYAIIMLDVHGTIVTWNAGAQRLKGYTEAEIIGCSIERFYTPEDIAAGKLSQLLLRAESEGSCEDKGWRVRADGSRFFADVVITALRDPAGTLAGFAKITRDITERQAAVQLQQEQEIKIARLSRIQAMFSAISTLIVRTSDRDELLRGACRIAVEHGDFGIVWVGLLDEEQNLNPIASAGVDPESFLAVTPNTAQADNPLGQGLVGRAVREQRVMIANDITQEKTQGGPRRAEAIRRGYRSLFVSPLVVESRVIGILSLFAKPVGFFDDDEVRLITEVADSISFALEHIAKAEKLESLSRIREVSSKVNAAIVRIHDPDVLLREICHIASDIGKFDSIWVASVNHIEQQVRAVAWHGFSDEVANSVNWTSINSAQRTIYDAIHHQKISILNQIKTLQSGRLGKDAVKRGARSTVCLPIVAENITVALIVLYVNEEEFFDEEEVALLNEISADISFALETISKQKKLDYLAHYDALTGLANSALFMERIEQRIPAAKRDGKNFEVVLLDVDRFRNINETIGRLAGDDLIRQIGQRFKGTVRDTDILAHVTADRFAIATRNLGMDDAAQALERILAAVFGAPFQVGDSELRITARAGIVVYPEDGGNVEVLLRNAEAALVKAKKTGVAYAFYQPAMNAKVAHNLLLENKLRQALDKEQFVLHYQPKINLATGRIDGLEALIRWQDPDSGLVPPIQFIPLLEETGMILEVGHWAMFQALYDYGKWLSRGLNPPRIAVNVSPIQLRQKNFNDVVHDALMRHPESAHGLDLEITESLIMEDIEGNIDRLRAVKTMGVKIAIDDFGTGYSSLSYLARLPVDALKIDRSFIITMGQSAENMAIVSTIISLAHALKLKVIAEGVDAEDQKSTLVTLGCDELQGYLFSRPLAAADLEARWLKPAAGCSEVP